MLDKIAAILAGVLVLMMLSSCGEPETGNNAAASTTEQTVTSTPAPSPTPLATATLAPSPTPDLTESPSTSPSPTACESPGFDSDTPRPPDATLTAGNATQVGGLGTYCWTEFDAAGGGAGLCADFAGLPVPEGALEVEGGRQVTLSVEGISALAGVSAQAFDFAGAEQQHGGLWLFYPHEDAVELPVGLGWREIAITADLPPGEYIISVFLRFPDGTTLTSGFDHPVRQVRGDGVYGFHIRVVDG